MSVGLVSPSEGGWRSWLPRTSSRRAWSFPSSPVRAAGARACTTAASRQREDIVETPGGLFKRWASAVLLLDFAKWR